MRGMYRGVIATLMAVLLLAAGTTAQMGKNKGFTEEDHIFIGTFVSFEFNSTSGNITDYTLTAGEKGPRSVRVFEKVTIENFSTPEMGEAQIRTVGAVFKAVAANASIKAIDSPVGHLKVANRGLATDDGVLAEARNTVNFTLDPSLTATVKSGTPEGPWVINITGENFRSFLIISAGSVEIQDSVISVKLVGPQSVHFHGLPLFSMAAGEAAFREKLVDQAALGTVATMVELRPEAEGKVEIVEASFRGDLQVTIQAALENRLSLQLISSDPRGAILALEISGELIRLDREIRVQLDGKEVWQAPALDHVVEAAALGKAQPAAYLLKTGESLKLSVYIPHFSTRTLTVEAVYTESGWAAFLLRPVFWILLGVVAAMGVGVLAVLRKRG